MCVCAYHCARLSCDVYAVSFVLLLLLSFHGVSEHAVRVINYRRARYANVCMRAIANSSNLLSERTRIFFVRADYVVKTIYIFIYVYIFIYIYGYTRALHNFILMPPLFVSICIY